MPCATQQRLPYSRGPPDALAPGHRPDRRAMMGSSVALSSSSPAFPCANRDELWLTGATSARAVALTLMPAGGWPIGGWPSSGRGVNTAKPTTRPITCSNALYVVDQDPDSSVVFEDSFQGFLVLASQMLTRDAWFRKRGATLVKHRVVSACASAIAALDKACPRDLRGR